MDFRNGHGLYLIFLIAFLQFVVTTYTLAIERISTLREIFPNMWVYALIFTVGYIPAATVIGHWHRKHQMPIEAVQNTHANPYLWQTAPGKERAYTMRMDKIKYELQLKQMSIMNAQSDSLEKITGRPVPKWQQADFDIIREFRYISERMENGDPIVDIYKDLKSPEAKGKLQELSVLYKEEDDKAQAKA